MAKNDEAKSKIILDLTGLKWCYRDTCRRQYESIDPKCKDEIHDIGKITKFKK